MEGGIIRLDNKLVRATCSCGTPPPMGRWSSFCVCVDIWTHSAHGFGGTMGGPYTAVRGIPEAPCAHRRPVDRSNDTGGKDRGLAQFRGARLAEPRRDGAFRLAIHMARANVLVLD